MPAGRDEIDEDTEIVERALRSVEDLLLQPLEPAERLIHEAADLGEVAADRRHLAGEPLAHRGAHLLGQRLLEPRGRPRERFDLDPRALERRVETGRLDSPGARLADAAHCTFENCFIHGPKATLGVG